MDFCSGDGKEDILGRGAGTQKGTEEGACTLFRPEAVSHGWVDVVYQEGVGIRAEGGENRLQTGWDRQLGKELEPCLKVGRSP